MDGRNWIYPNRDAPPETRHPLAQVHSVLPTRNQDDPAPHLPALRSIRLAHGDTHSLALVATRRRTGRREQKDWLRMVSTSVKGRRKTRSSLME